MFYNKNGTIFKSDCVMDLPQVNQEDIEIGYDGGLYLKGTAPIESYQSKRKKEYPDLVDQLDMIYWDKVNGTNLWQEKIAEIKAKYPKA